MTNPEVAILMLSVFIVMILLGFPVAFTLLAMGVGFGYYAYFEAGSIEVIADAFNNKIFYLLNQNTYSVMENDTLVAIPLFLFMGYVVERANIVNKLFYALQMAARCFSPWERSLGWRFSLPSIPISRASLTARAFTPPVSFRAPVMRYG